MASQNDEETLNLEDDAIIRDQDPAPALEDLPLAPPEVTELENICFFVKKVGEYNRKTQEFPTRQSNHGWIQVPKCKIQTNNSIPSEECLQLTLHPSAN